MKPHKLELMMNDYFHLTVREVVCPDEDQGPERPCAILDMGKRGWERRDACSLSEWVKAASEPEEFGFTLPKGTYWVNFTNPLEVFHIFYGEADDGELVVWPAACGREPPR